MARKKRIIWIPHGYRLCSSFIEQHRLKQHTLKQSNQEKVPSTESLNEPIFTNASSAEPSVFLEERSQQLGIASDKESKPQLAHLPSGLNPYQAYLNDMMLCLEGIPREMFIMESKTATHFKEEVDLPENENGSSVNENIKHYFIGKQEDGIERNQPHLCWLIDVVPSLQAKTLIHNPNITHINAKFSFDFILMLVK